MITVLTKEAIFVLHRRGLGPSEIAVKSGISRPTVRKALREGPTIPRYKTRAKQPCRVLGQYHGVINQWLKEDLSRPKKQRHTAKRVWTRLKELYPDFTANESTVRRYVHQQKQALGHGKEVFVPIEHGAGEEAQVDWYEVQAGVKGLMGKRYVFTAALSYSGKVFSTSYPHMTQDCFLDGLKQAFEHFDGVPKRCRFDNLKAAVKRVLCGSKREEQGNFIAFRTHYGFTASFCEPGKGNQKGAVEHSVCYQERNWFTPPPEFDDYHALNIYLLDKCSAELFRQPQGKTGTIGERFELEKTLLQRLPNRPYDCGLIRTALVDRCSRVRFEKHHFSVPVKYAYHEVTLRIYPYELVIAHKEREIARYPRPCEGDADPKLRPEHYAPLLERKPAALDVGKPFKDWKLPEVFAEYEDQLRRKGLREYRRILGLLSDYSQDELAEAMNISLGSRALGYEAIKLILEKKRHPNQVIPTIALTPWPMLAEVKSGVANASDYNRLLEGGERHGN